MNISQDWDFKILFCFICLKSSQPCQEPKRASCGLRRDWGAAPSGRHRCRTVGLRALSLLFGAVFPRPLILELPGVPY